MFDVKCGQEIHEVKVFAFIIMRSPYEDVLILEAVN